MHTSQIMLVVAESADDAKDLVTSRLENGYFEWSDWAEVGGRWSGEVVEGDALRYTDNSIKFEEVLTQYLGYRDAAMESYKKRLEDNGLDNVSSVEAPTTWDEEFKAYPLYKLGCIAAGIGSEDTAVYDLEYGTALLGDFRKRVEEKPEQQFLVVVDFHF